jgi:hypothetical protein
MKDPNYLSTAHSYRAASTVLASSNIALPDGLYVIPAEPVEEQRQPGKLPSTWAAGGRLSALLGLALTLMLLALFQMA